MRNSMYLFCYCSDFLCIVFVHLLNVRVNSQYFAFYLGGRCQKSNKSHLAIEVSAVASIIFDASIESSVKG